MGLRLILVFGAFVPCASTVGTCSTSYRVPRRTRPQATFTIPKGKARRRNARAPAVAAAARELAGAAAGEAIRAGLAAAARAAEVVATVAEAARVGARVPLLPVAVVEVPLRCHLRGVEAEGGAAAG